MRLNTIVPVVILFFLVMGSVVCSIAVFHMLQPMHANAGLCNIENFLTNAIISPRETSMLAGLLGFFVLLIVVAQNVTGAVRGRVRLLPQMIKLHNLLVPLRNYFLQALSQGILQPRVD